VAQDHEGHGAELPFGMEPAREGHALAGVRRELIREDSHPDPPPPHSRPTCAGGRRPRGATALRRRRRPRCDRVTAVSRTARRASLRVVAVEPEGYSVSGRGLSRLTTAATTRSTFS